MMGPFSSNFSTHSIMVIFISIIISFIITRTKVDQCPNKWKIFCLLGFPKSLTMTKFFQRSDWAAKKTGQKTLDTWCTAVWTGIEMSRDFFVKTSLTFFLPNNSSNQDSNGWEGITVVHGGHLSVILVVIFGFRQWEVREGKNMAQNRPRVYEQTSKVFLFGTLYRPLNRSRIPEKDSNQLGKPFGVHFWCP